MNAPPANGMFFSVDRKVSAPHISVQTYWTFDPTVYEISTIPVHVLTEDVLLVAGSAILITFLATVYPATQAAKLEPVAAFRYD